MRRFIQDEQGQDLVEYALLASLVAMASVAALKVLGPKAGPVLFQLPARFKADGKRLASFLKLLSKKFRYAFEFRDAS